MDSILGDPGPMEALNENEWGLCKHPSALYRLTVEIWMKVKITSQMICIQIYIFMVNESYDKYIYSLSDREKEHIN